MSASTVMPVVQKMMENPGVYITGDIRAGDMVIIMVSIAGKIYSTQLDRELAPDRFLDGFIVKSGPHK